MYQEIDYCVQDPLATVTLKRPDRLNALTPRMLAELRHAMAAAEKDPSVVAILLTGAGRGFCAGADMQGLKDTSEGKTRQAPDPELEARPGDESMGEDFQIGYTYFLALRKPVLAAINGPCAGLGFAIAMLTDLRFASDRATFTTAFANRGLIAEHCTSWILPRLMGPARALDLLWSGRKFDAAEADRLGFLNRVVPHDDLLDEAREYLTHLATYSSPTSLMIMKRQVYQHLMAPLGEATREANQLMAESLTRDDFREGVASYLEKRKPEFARIKVS